MKRAHKIMTIVIVVLILGGIFIYLSPSKATGKTIEQAIEKSGRQVVKVIHEEKVKGGEVVFFNKSIDAGKNSTIAAGYIKKTIWGWEWVIGGEHSRASAEPGQSLTAQYLPATKGTPFPLAFGEISDPQIVWMKVQTAKGTPEIETTIVENGATKIWFVFLNPTDGPQAKVIGQSQSGKIIASTDVSLLQANASTNLDIIAVISATIALLSALFTSVLAWFANKTYKLQKDMFDAGKVNFVIEEIENSFMYNAKTEDKMFYFFKIVLSNLSDRATAINEICLELSYNINSTLIINCQDNTIIQPDLSRLAIPNNMNPHSSISGWVVFEVEKKVYNAIDINTHYISVQDIHGMNAKQEVIYVREEVVRYDF
ncbi:hypothetical protein [Desulfosporosinus nitroreducens]|uniref:Uncharacterized protein n=1 Tax=Desulfosporosinus nitroreducens TaxID=2018668 RepID=A0ABT8QMH9_9FIRM|nr:hypothetical protein [Desulfosporosinus nitroreducens]MDO0822531.1 hypothetical protein [Desulfosporosinus nitroreducens]